MTPPDAGIEHCTATPAQSGGVASFTLNPPLHTWPTLLPTRPLSPEARTLRSQLGLPTDRPVIMSGHQPEIWHPGILAKWIAGAALARSLRSESPPHAATSATFAWLHVDQDTIEPGLIAFPAETDAGSLIAHTLTLIEPSPLRDVPPSARPATAIHTRGLPDAALSCASEGLGHIASTLNAHADAPTLALQFARTLHDLAEPIAGPALPILASQLASTELFADLVERMRRDPIAAIEAHNLAVAEIPEAGMRPLGLKRSTSSDHPPRVELPLWRVRDAMPREPVTLAQLAAIPPTELRPRALLMTALLRLGACDLFIHGSGGGVYDRITDLWLERWLGPSDLAHLLPLAPITVATATCHLPFPTSRGSATPEDAREAHQTFHRALHNPALLGDHAAADEKRSLVAAIRATPDRAERARLFSDMHALLARTRTHRTNQINTLRANADDAERRAAEAPVVNARTWAFPLYPRATFDTLKANIEAQL